MSAAAKYGSDNISLWTPSATGSEALSSDIVAWIDCEDTDEMTTVVDSGHSYVTIIKDKVNDISFGAPDNYQRPRFSNATDSLLINNRNTLHFWEASQQSTPDTALTATLDAFDGHLAELNDPRYAFFVYKPMDYYAGGNFLYQYGKGQTAKGYGLAMWVTGSSLTNTSHYYYMAHWGGGKAYYLDESDHDTVYYNKGGVPNLVYHQHNGTSGYISHDGNQTAASYSSTTLTTNNFDQDLELWIGEEISGGGRGIEFLLAEMIMITGSSFSDADRQRVEGYLAHKWGLTADLASNHPYKSSAPTNGLSAGGGLVFGNDAGRKFSIEPGNGGRGGPVLKRFENINCNYGKKDGIEQVPFALQQPGPFSLKRRTTAYKVTRGDKK